MIETIARRLSQRSPLQSLAPVRIWDEVLDADIRALDPERLTADSLRKSGGLRYAQAVKSGLHLWNDSLDRSHDLSQEIDNETGGYWHGLMHRMEKDYGNAKYWFRLVGVHPIFETLSGQVSRWISDNEPLMGSGANKVKTTLLQAAEQPKWNPYLFVDAVQQQTAGYGTELTEAALLHIQRIEMMLLLQFSYKRSSGGAIVEAG